MLTPLPVQIRADEETMYQLTAVNLATTLGGLALVHPPPLLSVAAILCVVGFALHITKP